MRAGVPATLSRQSTSLVMKGSPVRVRASALSTKPFPGIWPSSRGRAASECGKLTAAWHLLRTRMRSSCRRRHHRRLGRRGGWNRRGAVGILGGDPAGGRHRRARWAVRRAGADATGPRRRLVEDACERARAAGALRLEVVAGPAQGFYERVGFQVVCATETRFGNTVRMQACCSRRRGAGADQPNRPSPGKNDPDGPRRRFSREGVCPRRRRVVGR